MLKNLRRSIWAIVFIATAVIAGQVLGPELRAWVGDHLIWIVVVGLLFELLRLENTIGSKIRDIELELYSIKGDIDFLQREMSDATDDIIALDRLTGRKPSALP